MNSPKVRVLALLLSLGLTGLYAADAVVSSTDDLPPVPFIIGGDDAVSPSQSASAGPLMLPEDTASSAVEDSMIASAPSPEYISQVPESAPTVAPINDPVPMDLPGDLSSAPVEEKPTAPVAKKEATPTAPAPAATTPTTPATSEGLLPAYILEQPHKPVQVVGHDGSVQQVGLEHTVGAQNPLLAPVMVSPAVASVGDDFPELHVDQIPLEDLLMYLKGFTKKTLRYELAQPMYVTVDLKAKSVEEVLTYLAAHYPLSIVGDHQTIFVRSGKGTTLGIQAPSAPVAAPVAATAAPVQTIPSAEPMPIISSEPTRGGLMVPTDIQPVAPAPVPTPVYYEGMAPAEPAAPVSRWDEVHTKARLYELNKQREDLLDQKRDLQRKTRKAQIEREYN